LLGYLAYRYFTRGERSETSGIEAFAGEL
jgi:hypothetical protein